MIYRIVSRNDTQNLLLVTLTDDLMTSLGLRSPKGSWRRGVHVNPRARFWFTEAGWDAVGRHVAERAIKEGLLIRVKRRKNPKASAVVFKDHYQVAVLGDE